MQSLGSKLGRLTGRRQERHKASRTKGAGGAGSQSRPRILLRTTGGWHGGSQKFGGRGRGRLLRFAGFARPTAWRDAAFLFIAAAAVYGFAVSGYPERISEAVKSEAKSAFVRAGFRVERLTIEGQNRTSDKDIVRALGLGTGQSMLSFDSLAAQGRLEALPWVRQAQVMRLLPSRLHIVIEERTPYAVWQRSGKSHLVDADGHVIAPAAAGGHPNLPLVVGVGAAKAARELFDLLGRRPDFRKRVRAAVRVADRRWNLKLVNGVEIRLPEENLPHAVAKIGRLEEEHGILSRDVEVVDLRLPKGVTIRLTGDAAARRDAILDRTAPRPKPHGRDT